MAATNSPHRPEDWRQQGRLTTAASGRRGGGAWVASHPGRFLAGTIDMALGACVQTLFNGRCERPGGATYGRWGADTLRLTPGKVEISADNHSFRTLVEPWPGCPAGPPT